MLCPCCKFGHKIEVNYVADDATWSVSYLVEYDYNLSNNSNTPTKPKWIQNILYLIYYYTSCLVDSWNGKVIAFLLLPLCKHILIVYDKEGYQRHEMDLGFGEQ